MNIIETVRSILESFPKISDVCNEVHIDFADPEPTSYGLSSTGDELISEDVLGNQKRQHSFMLYSTFSSINDYERMLNSTALLELGLWLEEQTDCEIESAVGDSIYTGKLTKLTAANGMLYNVPQENELDGVQYQLQIIAEYTVDRF
ncbi:hypothetical protein [Ruminococcus flavefaciens]|uniref:hypothetical protein n=1 Tax=Ruminococcus flavefaciens TaxID=1265 RepID=UPI0026EE83F3|nr:hypothetical protein [Ruminococcus flavefaciens]